MPKYKNEKVVWLRFKVQDLIRNKGHLDFQTEQFIHNNKGVLWNLLLHRIFSELEGKKIFFKWKSKW
jgi:hypothetical protein